MNPLKEIKTYSSTLLQLICLCERQTISKFNQEIVLHAGRAADGHWGMGPRGGRQVAQVTTGSAEKVTLEQSLEKEEG